MFKKYRVKRGYTQEELAELMNLSWRQIQRIENNKSIPKMETFKKLVKVLKIDDKEILDYIKKD